MATKRNHLIWIGLLTTLVGLVSYFMVFARFPALRDFPWVNLPLTALGVAASAVAAARVFRRPDVFRGKVLAPIGLAVSLMLAGLFGLYIFRLSYLLPAPSEATLGLEAAPDFALASAGGETIRLSDLRGRKVLLIFYRGFW